MDIFSYFLLPWPVVGFLLGFAASIWAIHAVLKRLGMRIEWWEMLLIIILPIAVYSDVSMRAAILSLLLGTGGFIWTMAAISRSLASGSGWRGACLKAALPIMCFSSLPVTISLGVACQEIALSRAQDLRLALLEKLPKENLDKAYADLCGNKYCGFLSYKITPYKVDTPEVPDSVAKPCLLVEVFNDRRAIVDIESGKVTIPNLLY